MALSPEPTSRPGRPGRSGPRPHAPRAPRHGSPRVHAPASVVAGVLAGAVALVSALVAAAPPALVAAAGLRPPPGTATAVATVGGIAAGAAVLCDLWPRTTRWHQPAGVSVVLLVGAVCRWRDDNAWSPLLWLALVHASVAAGSLLVAAWPGASAAPTRRWCTGALATAVVVGATLTGPLLGARAEALGRLAGPDLTAPSLSPVGPLLGVAVVVVAGLVSVVVEMTCVPAPPGVAAWTDHRLVPWLLLATAWVSAVNIPALALVLVYPVVAWRRRPIDRAVLTSLPRPRRELAPR